MDNLNRIKRILACLEHETKDFRDSPFTRVSLTLTEFRMLTEVFRELERLTEAAEACTNSLTNAQEALKSAGIEADTVQAGVMELVSRMKRLGEENAALMKFCKNAAFDADYEAELGMERGGFTDAINDIKTPATDAYLNAVRAEGVEMLAAEHQGIVDTLNGDSLFADGERRHAAIAAAAVHFAAQLRTGNAGKDGE